MDIFGFTITLKGLVDTLSSLKSYLKSTKRAEPKIIQDKLQIIITDIEAGKTDSKKSAKRLGRDLLKELKSLTTVQSAWMFL